MKDFLFRNTCKEKRLRVTEKMFTTEDQPGDNPSTDHRDEISINRNACFKILHKSFA